MTNVEKWNFANAANEYFEIVPVWVYLLACVAYYPALRWGQRQMKNRPAYDLTLPLIGWNLFMSLASFYAGTRLLFALDPFSLSFPVCNQSIMNHPVAWFILVFNLTKPLEWIDTVFLVLRKRRVIFLHWFHHLATALYCVHATIYSAVAETTGVQFATVNLLVHGIMYLYYALTGAGYRDQLKSIAVYINAFQTIQMFAGICFAARSLWMCPQTWALNWHGMLLAFAMYGVYLYMFTKMLYRRIRV
jgi:hypothetical protein